MRKPSPRSTEQSTWNKGTNSKASTATETDPLLQSSAPSFFPGGRRSNTETHGSSIRSRKSSRSPTLSSNSQRGSSGGQPQQVPMNRPLEQTEQDIAQSYNVIKDDDASRGNSSVAESAGSSNHPGQSLVSLRRKARVEKLLRGQNANNNGSHPPLLEIPEEIYAVRKAALQVLKPLTKTWLVVSVGFALTVLFGMARWTRLLPELPYWFILLPSWLSHVGLFWCHLMSAKALSTFIAEANDSRQRPDSRDHLDRTEYLPLLQRSLKFGLKTGLLSFGIFIFEILIYIRLARGSVSLTAAFLPLWLVVLGGILDGVICKTQHYVRVICWMLTFAAMVLTVLKVDYGFDNIRWRVVVSPVVAVLSASSATLIYIVYGHQVGYYRLTESQLTAGNLYSLAALISIVLVVVIGEVIPLSRPVEIETRVFVVLMAPLVVTLVGMGAWVVSRDEFGRLLLYGGQAAVHPRKLRWESEGWTSVQGRGVTNIPMFGEVSFRPLEKKPTNSIELCMCCSCYPYEEDEEEVVPLFNEFGRHPYLAPNPSANPTSEFSHSPQQAANNEDTDANQTQTV